MLIWYAINLFIIFIFILLLIVSRKTTERWSKMNDYLGIVNETLNSVRYGDLKKKIQRFNPESFESLTDSINSLIDTLREKEKSVTLQQEKLIHQNKFLEAILNSLSDGLIIIDNKNNILRATPKISQWFNVKGQKIIHTNLENYIEVIDNTPINKLENTEIKINNYTADIFEASTLKLQFKEEEKKYIVIIKNVTNQKEMELLKENFVATLTHDLKVPIIAESNILEFLIKEKFGPVSEKQAEVIKNLQQSNNELINLVQILLETYKIKDSGIQLQFDEFKINPFINDIIQEMQPITERSNLIINYKSSEDFTITADKLQLKRVIKNLLQNAFLHSDSKKGIDIITQKTPSNIKISVIDYGKGISKKDIEMVFKKYYSTAKKFRKIGTGLGLYLAQQIVKSHGGEITVKSEDKQGTEFCVNLPIFTKNEDNI